MAFMIIGCRKEGQVLRPSLRVIGDLENWVELDELWNTLDTNEMDYREEKIEVLDMGILLEQLNPINEVFNLFLKAEDGFMVSLEGKSLNDTYLGFSHTDGWIYISDKHPVNSQIKEIEEMIFVSDEDEIDNHNYGLNLIDKDEDIHYSMGQLLTMTYQVYPQIDGRSSLESDGGIIEISVMKQKRYINLSSLVGHEVENILLMDEQGLHEYLSESGGIIEIAENQINYVSTSSDKTFRNIEGVFIDPPNHSVMDSFYDVQHYLDQGMPVLIVFIDGFSYDEYENFIYHWPESFLASLEPFHRATTVFKPVTNAGYAAMVTGQPPSENGILDRSYREVKTETIFDYAEKKGLSHFVIEGNTSIITLNTELVLSNDVNDDGFSDDEIFDTGLEYVKEGYDLGLVHFHSVDDYGHLTGANSDEVMERVMTIDGYTRQLVENWEGKVIIVADHGMHSTSDGGSHGEFRSEDLIIPYQITEGGIR
jgi:hypothetical protein